MNSITVLISQANEYMAAGLLNDATMALTKSLKLVRECLYSVKPYKRNESGIAIVCNSVMFNTHRERNDSFLSPSFLVLGTGNDGDIPTTTACILFNLGLCHHLVGEFSRSCVLYNNAWLCLQMAGSESPSDMEMTICYNISNCYYHMCELDSVRSWGIRLKHILENRLGSNEGVSHWGVHYLQYIRLEPNYIASAAA